MRSPTLDERVESLECKGLCQACCGPIPFPERLREQFPEMMLPKNPLDVRLLVRQKGPYACPFLAQGRCTIYEQRPAICRLWGASRALQCPFGCLPRGALLSRREGHRYLREHGEGTI